MLPCGLKHNSAGATYVDRLRNLMSILQRSTIPEDARSDIAGSQLRNKNTTHSTTTDEMIVIYSLKRDCNITILPADKGGATFVLGTEEYEEKAIQQLPDATTHHVLTSDPTPKQTRAIQKNTGQTGARGSPTTNCSVCDITEGNFNRSC